MKSKYFCALLVLILPLLFIQEVKAFSIEPSRIELDISAGKQKGKTVIIDNSKSDEPLHIKVYAQDIMYLPDGTNDFLAPGTTEWSCANWIKAIPEELDIPPGKTQAVRLSLAVPEQARGGYYAMVFFESGPTMVQGLGINFRIGALLDLTVSGTEYRKAELADISFIKPRKIEIDIFNEGNILMRPKGVIKILNAQGRKIKQFDFNPPRLGVLPKSLRKFYSELPEALAAGTYRIKAEIDYGTKYLLVAELPIEIR